MLTRLLLIACLLSSSSFARDKNADAPNKDLIQKVMDAWASLDASKPAPYYAKDADNVYFDILPLKYNGWDEYSKGAAKVFGDYKSLKLRLNDDLKVHRQGNTAWTTFTWHADAEMKDGSKENFDARDTAVWEKRGGEWLIVHEHASVPMQTPAK